MCVHAVGATEQWVAGRYVVCPHHSVGSGGRWAASEALLALAVLLQLLHKLYNSTCYWQHWQPWLHGFV